MTKKLVIVESAAKAATIKKYLGRNYKVEASVGHVRDLPKSRMGIDIENDYQAKYITIRGKGKVLAKLKKEAKRADEVILATDPDREGEAISWHLATALQLDVHQNTRVTFHEITKNAVTTAIKNPRTIDMNLVNAQQSRRFIDRIVGYSISPLLWKNIKKGLSAGRVQSVALRMICDRENEITDFEPEEYWTLDLIGYQPKDPKTLFLAKFHGKDGKKMDLPDQKTTEHVMKELQDSKFSVKQVKKTKKQRNPAPPFITSTLQQEASRKLNFSTRKTMMLAQQLYEGINVKGEGNVGLVTYIRTDSQRIAPEAQQMAKEWILGKYGQKYYPKKPKIYKKSSGSQDAHECIRPTSFHLEPAALKDSLSRDQLRLYRLIWQRFMASQMSNAVYNSVRIDIVDQKEYLFRMNGSNMLFDGFMKIYIESSDHDQKEEEDSILPDLEEGDSVIAKELKPKQNFTQPPSRYTEASLVKALEDNGIGRPSTYSPTISTIQSRGYIVREKKTLYPTELGFIVNRIMIKHFQDIVDLRFTANMEQRFDTIEQGKMDWKQVIDEFYQPFSKILDTANEKIGKVELKDEVSDIVCEKCGKNMVYKLGKYGKFLACPGFPDCRNTKAIIIDTGVLCPKCQGKVLEKKSKKGRTYYACENHPSSCSFHMFDKPTKESCPNCNTPLARRRTSLTCANEDCDFMKPLSESKTDEKTSKS